MLAPWLVVVLRGKALYVPLDGSSPAEVLTAVFGPSGRCTEVRVRVTVGGN